MSEEKGITLAEILKYVKENNCEMEDAIEHFQSTGRLTIAERSVVPDGYTLPDHKFVITESAYQRIAELGQKAGDILKTAEAEFEGLMIDIVRSGGSGKEISFMFHCFAIPPDDYEKGYTLVPADDNYTINIEASNFTSITSFEFDDEFKVVIPDLS